MNTKNVLLYGGIALAAVYLINSANDDPLVKDLSPNDIKLLNTSASDIKPIIQADTSPVVFTVSGNAMTPEQREAALAVINERFANEMTKLAATLNIDSNILGNAFISIMALKDGVVREQSLNTFMAMFTAYSTLFNNAALILGQSIAGIVAASTGSMNNATTCAEWTFTKDTTYDATQTTSHVTTVQHGGSTNSVLFGLFGKKKRSSSTYTTVDTNIIAESKTEAWIPHCTSKVIDVEQISAILISQRGATIAAYGPLQSVLKFAPNIENFVQTTTT